MLSIQLVEHHAVVRAGVRYLVDEEQDMRVVAESDTGAAAILDFERIRPDLVVCAISLPDMNGVDVAERMLDVNPEANILILSMYEEGVHPERAIKSGIRGYMTKSGSPEELIKAIRCTARGERYLEPGLAQRMALRSFSGNDLAVSILTEREYEVFLLLAEGKSVKAIADILHVSPKTIGTHRLHVLQKLNAANVVELSRIAIRCGFMEA